jgi:WD40 repeat protein
LSGKVPCSLSTRDLRVRKSIIRGDLESILSNNVTLKKNIKKGKINFDIMFDSRFEISKNGSKVFGKIVNPHTSRLIVKMICSENLTRNKIEFYKPHKSEIFCVKLNRKNDLLFIGDFEGILKQYDNHSHKIMTKYELECVIWSIEFINSSFILIGGNDKICLINFQKKIKVKNVYIDQLGTRMAQVIYKMQIIPPNQKYSFFRLICKTNHQFPFIIKLHKLKNLISKNQADQSRSGILDKRSGLSAMLIIN